MALGSTDPVPKQESDEIGGKIGVAKDKKKKKKKTKKETAAELRKHTTSNHTPLSSPMEAEALKASEGPLALAGVGALAAGGALAGEAEASEAVARDAVPPPLAREST